MRHRVANAISPRHDTLTIIGGDFNWTVDEQDRRSKSTMASTGRNGIAEELHFWAAWKVSTRYSKMP